MDVVVGFLEKESYEEALTALREFNEKVRITYLCQITVHPQFFAFSE